MKNTRKGTAYYSTGAGTYTTVTIGGGGGAYDRPLLENSSVDIAFDPALLAGRSTVCKVKDGVTYDCQEIPPPGPRLPRAPSWYESPFLWWAVIVVVLIVLARSNSEWKP